MMKTDVILAALFITILALLACMAYALHLCLTMRRGARRAKARLLGVQQREGSSSVIAQVELICDGAAIVCHTQPCRFSAVADKIGQQVEVLYHKRKEFGRSRLNVFILDGRNTRPYRLYACAAAIFGLLAVVMGAVLGILLCGV